VAVVQWALSRDTSLALWPIMSRLINRFSAASDPAAVGRQLSDFMRQRVEAALKENLTFREKIFERLGVIDIIRSVLGARWDPILDAKKRAEALAQISLRPDFAKEMQTFSRVTNILPKNMKGDRTPRAIDDQRFQESAERDLHHAYHTVGTAVEALWRRGDYVPGYGELLNLRPAIDVFFEKVMVMVDDPAVRDNRLALLHHLHLLFLQFADFSQLVIA
jgi:glycyl-tRNA synthetase beta chain